VFLETILIGLGIVALLLVLGALALEIRYRRHPGNDLVMTSGDWNLEVYEPDRYLLVGEPELPSRSPRVEIMVLEVEADVTLLSKGSLDEITHTIKVTPRHPDAPARPDGYWFGYIIKRHKTTRLEVSLDIRGKELNQLQAAWVQIRYMTYGPRGRIPKVCHVIVPLKFPTTEDSQRWRPTLQADVLPVKTHLLTHLDDPVAIVKRYVMPHAQPGDIVTIGETPVAVMQGRFHHPSEVHPGWVAKRLCFYFMTTSTLSSACGMQTLVDIVGPVRVLFAFVAGAIAKKFLNQPGMFYQLAGEQARLIDDVTGTLPPYDQFIVLGPENPQQVVDQIKAETGLSAAIVDVNDLKAVNIVASTSSIPKGLLEQALVSNPAGNDDQQTPVVLIRPTETAANPKLAQRSKPTT
jgi:hypothetical protein